MRRSWIYPTRKKYRSHKFDPYIIRLVDRLNKGFMMDKKEEIQRLNLKIESKDIDPGALFIIKRLNDLDYEALVVGGCIRNLVMRQEANDWDVTTNATPEEITQDFKDYKVVPVGKKFGTVTVVINHVNYQVSTFKRSKSAGVPNLFEDLRHRDYTINALAWREGEGIIDYFNGLTNLKQKLIRGVEDPAERIKEDPLRMLRAVRLACELDFEVDKATLQAIEENSSLIKKVSQERIRDELIKILLSNSPKRGIKLLYQSGLLKFILPSLESGVGFYVEGSYKGKDLFSYILDILENLTPDLALRLSILLYDIEKSQAFYSKREITDRILHRLRFNNSLINKVNILIREDWQKADFSSNKNIRQSISRVGEENILSILELKRADLMVSKEADKFKQIEKIEKELRKILKEKPPTSIKDLAINGKDLIDLGYQEGKGIGNRLKKLLKRVIDMPELNKREILLGFSKLEDSNFFGRKK